MTEPVTKYPGDNITSAWANALRTYLEDLEPGTAGYTYMIYENTGVYYAKNGATNENDFSGPVLLEVAQDAIDSITEGQIFFKDLSIPAGLVEKDGVILLSRNDGTRIYRYTNPTSEVLSMNPNDAVMEYWRSTPTNNPVTGAWNLLTAEIYGTGAAISKFLVGAYISAAASAGCTSQIWAVNPTVVLSSDAGAAAEALCVEIDVNNDLADDKGYGLSIEGIGTHNCNRAMMIKRDTVHNWRFGITMEDIGDTGIVFAGNYAQGCLAWTPASDADGVILYATDLAVSKPLCELRKSRLFFNQLDAFTADFLLFQHADSEVFKMDNTGECRWATDTNLYRIAANVLATNDAMLALEPGGTNDAFCAGVSGDSVHRWKVRADGAMYWGTGSGAADVYLYRPGAGKLRTNSSFQADGSYLSADGTSGGTATVVVRDSAGTGTIALLFKDGLFVGTA